VYKGENYIVHALIFLKVKNRKKKKLVFKNCGVPLKSIFQIQHKFKKLKNHFQKFLDREILRSKRKFKFSFLYSNILKN